MKTEYFIARRLFSDKENKHFFSRSIVRYAVFSISLGLMVMILSIAIMTGFKKEITEKVVGFGSHIQILNFDNNSSYETKPIGKNQEFIDLIQSVEGIRHIQEFALEGGIIRRNEEIEGTVLKGIGEDFDWTFFKKNLKDGEILVIDDSVRTDNALISNYLSKRLDLQVGDDFSMYFVQNPPRMRKFKVKGIYETSLMEFDKIFVLVDIKHVQKLNNWNENQVSGFEIMIDDMDRIDELTYTVDALVGFDYSDMEKILKVVNIKEKYTQIFDWLELQDINVYVILILMILVSGFNMISGLLILILERTNMIGVLKAMGATNVFIRKVFIYQAGLLILRGFVWGNVIGISLAFMQKYFHIIKLDEASYYLQTVPIHLELSHLVLLNIGVIFIILFFLVIPSMIISSISPAESIRFE
ncbi:ABC transporter permease [Bacteroidota bacterium]